MKKNLPEWRKEMRRMSVEETMQVSGGSLVSSLVRIARWGAVYFFNMGVQEGRKMRAML